MSAGTPSFEIPPVDADPRARRCPICANPRCKQCTVNGCPLWYCQHHPCEVCGQALEHTAPHPDGRTTDEEWEGRARMARAAQAGGQPLTATDERALARCPDPSLLTANGYVVPPGPPPASPRATQAPQSGDPAHTPRSAA